MTGRVWARSGGGYDFRIWYRARIGLVAAELRLVEPVDQQMALALTSSSLVMVRKGRTVGKRCEMGR